MRYTTLVLAYLLLFAPAAAQSVEVDPSDGRKIVSSSSIAPLKEVTSGGAGIGMDATCQTDQSFTVCGIRVLRIGSGNVPINRRPTISTGGRSIEIKKAQYVKDAPHPHEDVEALVLILSPKSFQTLSRADRIEISIGRNRWVTDRHQSVMQRVYKKVFE